MFRVLKVFLQVLLLLQALIANAIPANFASAVPDLSAISDSDIRNSAIAFVSTSTSPGLEGATITVDSEDRYSEQLRYSLGFSAEFTLKKHIFNGYWGLAIVGGSLDDKIDVIADTGEQVALNLEKEARAPVKDHRREEDDHRADDEPSHGAIEPETEVDERFAVELKTQHRK